MILAEFVIHISDFWEGFLAGIGVSAMFAFFVAVLSA